MVRWMLVALVCGGCGSRTDLGLSPAPATRGTPETPTSTPTSVPTSEPPDRPDVCNGIDDDGDGVVDEGPLSWVCGLGACRAQAFCNNGEMLCAPGAPSEERCNGTDDDCDGAVDEGVAFQSLGPPTELWAVPGRGLLGADLVAVADGLLVALEHTTETSPPLANQVTIRTTLSGQPTGLPISLDTRFTHSGPRLSLGPNGLVSIATCGNDGPNSFAYSALVEGETGVLRGRDVRRSPTDRSCGAMTPEGYFVGEHLLYGWVENSSNAEGTEVIYDVANVALASQRTLDVTSDGNLAAPPRFAANQGRIAFAFGVGGYPRPSKLQVHVFMDPLAPLLAPLDVEAPAPDDWADLQLLPAATGFMIFADNRFEAGLLRLAIGFDGELFESPTRIEGAGGNYAMIHATNRSRGGFALAAAAYGATVDGGSRTTVFSLDDRGRVVSSASSEAVAAPLAARDTGDDRVAVLLSESRGESRALLIEFFGCGR